MDEQITLEEWMASKKPPEYGDRGCRVCYWYNNRKDIKGCYWNDPYWYRDGFMTKQIYPNCKFMPDSSKGLHMCSNCEHSNQFEYQEKPEYKGNHTKAMYDPVEEPNIYCDHCDGSLNRYTAYKDLEEHNFGVGRWHRQHEWDTCDRWEEENGNND